MLPNFRFTRYRFTYTVGEQLQMPRHKGNIFRGRFGYLLRKTTCVGDEGECDNKCRFPGKCVYSKCFETPVPDDSPILRGQPFAPHPFILEPPRTGKRDYVPGDTFTCDLVLIGEAIDLLPWMVFTFHEIGKRRIGLRDKRGQCQLEKVESLSVRGSDPRMGDQSLVGKADLRSLPERSRIIYTAETEMLSDEGQILRLADIMEDAPYAPDAIELEFLTPTSIKVDGRWTSDLTFEHLIRNLLRRIRLLSYFHCGEDLDVDAPMLIEAARAVKGECRFCWVRRKRKSGRTKRIIPMDGFIGEVRFEGELEPFLPLILLGEYLHIGHHTAFGHGQYRLISFPCLTRSPRAITG